MEKMARILEAHTPDKERINRRKTDGKDDF